MKFAFDYCKTAGDSGARDSSVKFIAASMIDEMTTFLDLWTEIFARSSDSDGCVRANNYEERLEMEQKEANHV